MREFPAKKKEAILTVVMDRLIGMAALVLTALLTTFLRWNWLQKTPQATVLLWVLLSMLIGFVLITAGSFAITGFNLVDLNRLQGLIHETGGAEAGRGCSCQDV